MDNCISSIVYAPIHSDYWDWKSKIIHKWEVIPSSGGTEFCYKYNGNEIKSNLIIKELNQLYQILSSNQYVGIMGEYITSG